MKHGGLAEIAPLPERIASMSQWLRLTLEEALVSQGARARAAQLQNGR